MVAILIITIVITGPLYGILSFAIDLVLMAPTAEQVDDEKASLIRMKQFVIIAGDTLRSRVRSSVISLANRLSLVRPHVTGPAANSPSAVAPILTAPHNSETPAGSFVSSSSRRRGVLVHNSRPRLGSDDSTYTYDEESGLRLVPSGGFSPNDSPRGSLTGAPVDEYESTQLLDRTMTCPREYKLHLRAVVEAAVQRVGHGEKLLMRDIKEAECMHISRQGALDIAKQSDAQPTQPASHGTTWVSQASTLGRKASVVLGFGEPQEVKLTDDLRCVYIVPEYREQFESVVTQLELELSHYRRSLSKEDLEAGFDKQWGLHEATNMHGGANRSSNGSNTDADYDDSIALFQSRSKSDILKRIAAAVTEANESYTKLETMANHHKGAEIVRLYVEDCLGLHTKHALTFRAKFEDEFKKHRAINFEVKAYTAGFIILLNVFFVAACLVYSYNRGQKWQRVWLLSCLLKVALDVFFKRFVQGVVVGFAVPNLVANDLAHIRARLGRAGRRLLNPRKSFRLNKFSATDYMHASNMLARQFPHLLEAQLVLMHRDGVPERLVQRRLRTMQLLRRESTDAYSIRKTGFFSISRVWIRGTLLTLSLMVTNLALIFGSLDSETQKLCIHLIPSTLVVAVGYLVSVVSERPLEGIFGGCMFLLLVGAATYMWARSTFFNTSYERTQKRARAMKSRHVKGRKTRRHSNPNMNTNANKPSKMTYGIEFSSSEE